MSSRKELSEHCSTVCVCHPPAAIHLPWLTLRLSTCLPRVHTTVHANLHAAQACCGYRGYIYTVPCTDCWQCRILLVRVQLIMQVALSQCLFILVIIVSFTIIIVSSFQPHSPPLYKYNSILLAQPAADLVFHHKTQNNLKQRFSNLIAWWRTNDVPWTSTAHQLYSQCIVYLPLHEHSLFCAFGGWSRLAYSMQRINCGSTYPNLGWYIIKSDLTYFLRLWTIIFWLTAMKYSYLVWWLPLDWQERLRGLFTRHDRK